MTPDEENPLTSSSNSGTSGPGKERVGMEPDDKQWSKRINWANCREPYKTELDALGSLWVEGTLTNEGLAFEAVKTLSELEWVSQPGEKSKKVDLNDVIAHVKILTEAMLAVSLQPSPSPQDRLDALEHMRMELGGSDNLER